MENKTQSGTKRKNVNTEVRLKWEQLVGSTLIERERTSHWLRIQLKNVNAGESCLQSPDFF